MIFKLYINPETLDVDFDDPNMVVNHAKLKDGIIEIEVSKPDPESVYAYNFSNTWQS